MAENLQNIFPDKWQVQATRNSVLNQVFPLTTNPSARHMNYMDYSAKAIVR